MGRILKWLAVILGIFFLGLLAVIFFFGLSRFGGMPMMARGFGYRMPYMYGGYRLVAWPFMIARMLIPLVLIALLLLGGFLIGRDSRRPQPPVQAAVASCPNCGQPVQAGWNNCPNCGTVLRSVEPPTMQGDNI